MDDVLQIILISFLSEDLALISGIYKFQSQEMTLSDVYIAYVLGVTIGDIVLFLAGVVARYLPFAFIQKWVGVSQKFLESYQKKEGLSSLDKAIILTRFIPGTRLPSYIALGFMNYSFFKFTTLLVVVSSFYVLLSLLFVDIISLEGQAHWSTALLSAVLVYGLTNICIKLISFWYRERGDLYQALRMLKYHWLRWRYFEFWPSKCFYFPIYFIFPSLMLKYFSLDAYLYTNLGFDFGGLIGEKKSEMEKCLNSIPDSYRLKWQLIEGKEFESRQSSLYGWMEREEQEFPIVLKPQQGQRGAGVKIIQSREEAAQYMSESTDELIVQEYCDFENELGLFYIKPPWEEKGFVFSTTLKVFPQVVGDGQRTVGNLVLADSRARYLAFIYRKQLGHLWNKTPDLGESVTLVHYGNHARGTIFEVGDHLINEVAVEKISQLSASISGFCLGRFDIRFKNKSSWLNGDDFKIIELNGAGAEATHIYDTKISLYQAYKVLLKQWKWVFSIGAYNKRKNIKVRYGFGSFLKEVLKFLYKSK